MASTTHEIASLIKTTLEAATWPGGDVAFGQVLVTAGIDLERTRAQLRWPFCLILPSDMTVDDEAPTLVTQRFTLLVAQRVANDPWGETVILGGAGSGTGLNSLGRGVLELEEVLFDALALLSEQDSVNLQLISASGLAAELDSDIGYVAQRSYTFEAWTGAGASP